MRRRNRDTHKLYARIHRALQQRFRAPEWALLHEVANATGGRARRSADAIAINLWPSRGIEVQGIEVKVTRSDWLRELRQPEKSGPVQKYCDRWWVAVPPDIVQLDEVPVTWGLLVLRKRGLVTKKSAPQLDAAPLDRGFVASVGRRMHECVERARDTARKELGGDDAYERGFEKGKAEGVIEGQAKMARVSHAHDQLLADVQRFERASGLKINGYNGAHLGEGVAAYLRMLKALRYERMVNDMTRAANRLREFAASIDTCCEELRHAEAVMSESTTSDAEEGVPPGPS